MAIKEAKEDIKLLDDFNIYYLVQSRAYIVNKKQIKYLLAKTDTKDFILAILKGKFI